MKPKLSKAVSGNSYGELLSKLKKIFIEGIKRIEQEKLLAKWEAGKVISVYILNNKKRAQRNKNIYGRLAKDMQMDIRTLQQCVKFYKTLPYASVRSHMNWTIYRKLLTIPSKDERKRIEAKIIQEGWSSDKLQEYLNAKRSLPEQKDANKPIPQLAFSRGVLWTRSLAQNPQNAGELLLDMGFTLRKKIEDQGLKLTMDDYLRIGPEDNSFTPLEKTIRERDSLTGLTKVTATKEEIFTYKASVVKIIDGDTIKAFIELGLGMYVQQKLRFRGIDCPEMDTEEGVRAKKFVQARLNKCDFIIVKTYKDSSDKYDRYLADVFYLADEKDPYKVAQQGIYLNQELLDKGLAREMKD